MPTAFLNSTVSVCFPSCIRQTFTKRVRWVGRRAKRCDYKGTDEQSLSASGAKDSDSKTALLQRLFP